MKKEILFKRLEEMILPSELQKDDSKLKHSQRQDKWKHCDNIRKNVMTIVGIPAIDKDFVDDDLRTEMPFLFTGVNQTTIDKALQMMGNLNCFTKTGRFNNKQVTLFYFLKKELVCALLNHTNIIQYECMHYKFEDDPTTPAYYAIFGYESEGKHVLIHQPLTNVKKFFSEEELVKEKENATLYADNHHNDQFENTEEETILYTKKLSQFYFYVKAIHRSFK